MTLHRLAAVLSAVPLAFTMAHMAHAGQHSHRGGGGHVGGMHGDHAQIAPGHPDRGHPNRFDRGHFDRGRFHGGAGAFPHRDGFGHRDGFRHDGFRQDGRFVHGLHGGRVGWWWVAGGAWYPWYADTAPVYSAPASAYVAPTSWWFYCPSAGTYYPYVTYCPEPWLPVEAAMPAY